MSDPGRHVLHFFFAETNPCNRFNVDIGGYFGSWVPDGFCNIHDANQTLTAFAGTISCQCGPAPEFGFTIETVDEARLTMRSPRSARPGDRVKVRVFMDRPIAAFESYQLDVAATGGRKGQLELVDIAIEPRKDDVFSSEADPFDAFSTVTGQMLRGLALGHTRTLKNGYLARNTVVDRENGPFDRAAAVITC
jgi:hypothetical protein